MQDKTPSQQIDDIITLYGVWKADVLSTLCAVINAADPNATEEVKWKMPSRPEGLPVWYDNGIMCLIETFKNDIKLVFTKGVLINDSKKLFNARLNSATDRAIEFKDGSSIDKQGITGLVKQAAQLNIKTTKK